MRRGLSVFRWVVVGVSVAAMLTGLFFFNYPPDPLRCCQKQLSFAVEEWLVDNKTANYPNKGGDGEASLRTLSSWLSEAYFRDYAYVPGLQTNDPKELVLLYLRKKTRRTWNGDFTPTILSEKRWMVIGPDFWWNGDGGCGSQLPEGGQVLSTEEFTNRLAKTLGFLKDNDRPYWASVVKEHSQFLKSIGNDDRAR